MTPATPARTAASSSTFMTRPVQPVPAVPRLLDPVTVQPAPASRSAQARPIPSDAPVISATRADCPIWLSCRVRTLLSAARPDRPVPLTIKHAGARAVVKRPATKIVAGRGRGSVRVGELGRAPGELGADGLGLVLAADQGADLLLLGGEAGLQVGPVGQVQQALRGPDRVRAAGRDRAGQLEGR